MAVARARGLQLRGRHEEALALLQQRLLGDPAGGASLEGPARRALMLHARVMAARSAFEVLNRRREAKAGEEAEAEAEAAAERWMRPLDDLRVRPLPAAPPHPRLLSTPTATSTALRFCRGDGAPTSAPAQVLDRLRVLLPLDHSAVREATALRNTWKHMQEEGGRQQQQRGTTTPPPRR